MAKMEPKQWATIDKEEVFKKSGSSTTGLSGDEAAKRLAQYGRNVITTQKGPSRLKAFFKNFSSLMSLLLWIAGGIAFVAQMHELGVAIWLVNIINGLFSFWQQQRAQAATDALQKMLPSYAKVLRDGAPLKVTTEELVPGDIVLLNSGDNIPADGRLFVCDSLQVNQSSLTGEAVPVSKEDASQSQAAIQAAGRFSEANLVYEGTSVVAGSGQMIVLATGMDTEFGQIASLTGTVTETVTPLEKELNVLTRQISVIAIIIGILFFIAAVFVVKYPIVQAFLFALGMVVAFIPEGLLPTVTLALANAVQKMAKRNALVKHLNSVETLGETTVICSDKTGTLTKNQMTIEKVWLPVGEYAVSGSGYEAHGNVTQEGRPIELSLEQDLETFIRIGALCNNSAIEEKDGHAHLVGGPDEGSLLVLAQKALFPVKQESQSNPRIKELPFDSQRKRMSTIHQGEQKRLIFTKGGINEVLAVCSQYRKNGKVAPLTADIKREILTQNDQYAKEGLRTLACAYRPLAPEETDYTVEATEQNLIFVGLSASQDPPRDNVMEAIEKCHKASIRIIMVTGDYGLTAESIARKIGIVQGEDLRIITGDQLAQMSDAELKENLTHEIIFARVAPEQKYRVVDNLQQLGEVVASTGDGVNDAPALKKADIGVAMGITGTDVAKEAADMILTDDNFTSIVNAIEEGRTVYANIRRFLLYILNSNVPEAVPSLLFLLSRGMIPLPLTVIQILTIDLGTDIFPALGLASEPTEEGLMENPPREKHTHLLTKKLLWKAFGWYGLMASLFATLAYFFVNWRAGWPSQPLAATGHTYVLATTMTLAAIVFSQIGAVFNCRTNTESLFKVGFFSNRRVLFGIVAEIVIILALVYLPILQGLFHTTGIELQDWLFLIAIPLPIILLEELRKAWLRRKAA